MNTPVKFSSPSCRTVPLQAIKFTKDWSLHPWEGSVLPEELRHSFQQIGILHKPILLAAEDNCYSILSGFKRLLFSLESAKSECAECLVLPEDTAPVALLNTILADQCLASRPLSLTEKARFVEICSRYLSNHEIIAMYLDRLKLRKNSSTLKELRAILQLNPLIIAEIHAGRLQEKIVTELLCLTENADQSALVQLFRDLGMGDGKQRSFYALFRDLSLRKNHSISAYLQTPEILQILNHPVLNIPQKVQHLNDYLQQQLCPMYSQAEMNFRQQVRDLRLPPRCNVSHSPSFEKDEITLSITFENFADCAERISNIIKSLA
jgi:ParB family transcriptional regulator, chromosome partitioning protein